MANIRYQNKWAGYTNFMDITNSPINTLAAGSQNVFIEDGSKLEARAGMAYFGIAGTKGVQTDTYWTLAHRIHSKCDEFVNKQGIKIPLRVFYDGHTAVGDVMEVWLPEYIAGVAQTTKKWYRVTSTNPTLPIMSTHRWYFAEWFDPTLSVVQAELIFTYGATKIGNWSGGFAPITAVTPTTITTNDIWTAKGFLGSPEGSNIITVNGVEYTVTSGFGTNTVTVASTTGISVNDVAFSNIYFNDTLSGKTTYDVCSIINNQVYYQDWNQRNVYISWNRNQSASFSTTIFNGLGLDDAVISGTFTGTTIDTYKVIINSTVPDINEQSFLGTGINDGAWNTTNYSGAAGSTNIYNVAMVGDVSIAVGAVGGWVVGEVVQGASASVQGVVVSDVTFAGNHILGIRMLTSDNFVAGGGVTGLSSATTSTVVSAVFQNWYTCNKNGVLFNTSGSYGSQAVNAVFSAGPINLSDNLVVTFASFYGHNVGDTFTLKIRTGGIDTFQWSENNGTLSAGVPITGGTQSIGSNGATIKFTSTNGHSIGDSWTSTGTQAISRGWSNFSYDNPNRLPGQGFIITLDSNGWTMKPQETTMLINAQAGHFYDVSVKLSANLLGETITVTRLKSEPQNKVLFPYLLNYIKNQLATVTNEKTFDVLGRQKFLELQQSKTISDAVRIDFATVDWEDGDVLYFKRKIYFNIPRTTAEGVGGCIFVYDDYRKYWHPPQVFSKRISLLSVIDDKLIGHSYEENESYELFTGITDLGTFKRKTKIVLPYDSSGNRYMEKALSAVGFEGYMDGAPTIAWRVNSGLGGCQDFETGTIQPLNTLAGMCLPVDKASLGKSGLGFHGLGNDPAGVPPHFFYIKAFDNMMYYQRNLEIECNDLEQRWSFVSLGTDLNQASINNSSITDEL